MKSSRIANSAHRPRSRSATPSSVRKAGLGRMVGRVEREQLLELVEDQARVAPFGGVRDEPVEVLVERRSSASSGARSLTLGRPPLLQRQQRAQDVPVADGARVGQVGRFVADPDRRVAPRKSRRPSSGRSPASSSDVLPAPEGE